MAAASFPVFAAFDPHSDSASVSLHWHRWLARFEIFLQAMNITTDARKRAMLVHYAGDAVYDIFSTLTEVGSTYLGATSALTAYFAPQRNREYEVYVFRQATQLETETLDDFHTRLRKLSKFCEFHSVDREIKSQLIYGIRSSRLRRFALRDPDLTLNTILEQGRLYEASERQAAAMEKAVGQESSLAQVDAVRRGKFEKGPSASQTTLAKESREGAKKCFNCGYEWPHNGTTCPAKGKICKNCKKRNHFAKCCRSTARPKGDGNKRHSVRVLAASDREDGPGVEEVFYVHTVKGQAQGSPRSTVKVNGKDLEVTIDSGATVNVIGVETYRKLGLPALAKTKVELRAYGSKTSLPVVGRCKVTFKKRQKTKEDYVYVVGCPSSPLLGFRTAEDLGLIIVVKDDSEINTIENSGEQVTWKSKFPKLFGGIGKLVGYKAHLHIDKTISEKVQPHRRIPFAMRQTVEEELEKLEKADIIERVTGPTPWVSPIVLTPKPKEGGKVVYRMCVDMRLPNVAITRERHITPTAEDILAAVNGAVMFSKIDLKMGYHQVELDEESRVITTFSTHVGLRRYKRLFFGITSAAELFQDIISQVIAGIDGALNASDDILIYGVTAEEHDRALEAVLRRLQNSGLTLNEKKCEFRVRTLVFFGFTLSDKGVSADPAKIVAFTSLKSPETVEEVHSLIGMIQYCGRFIPELATITHPIRKLLKKGALMEWNSEHQVAFEKLKSLLSEDIKLAYFDPKLKIKLDVDASPVGLGAILSQEDPATNQTRVVAYASKALSDVQSRYSQIERELLAVQWAIEHYHLFVYGTRFTVYTDHQPLVHILTKHHLKTSARIERLCVKVQPYTFDIVYRPGKDNPSDYLSRHPVPYKVEDDDLDQYLNYIVEQAVPKALTKTLIAEETGRDSTLQAVISELRKAGRSELGFQGKDLLPFKRIRQELSVHQSGILLRGPRIVVPLTLQKRCVELAHTGHQGLVKTKMLLREKIWFPGIDGLVENLVKGCLACQAAVKGLQEVPLQMTELPERVWSHLVMDFAGPFPDGCHALVLIDEYSRYPVVHTVKSLTCSNILDKLEVIFAMFGFPDRLKTDNGPPFNAAGFTQRLADLGCYHHKVTKLWPQANGEAERFMRTLNKFVQTVTSERKPWAQELRNFLMSYRATPHATTGTSPSEILFGRKMKTWFPDIGSPDQDNRLREVDSAKKGKIKSYADSKRRSAPHDFRVGDFVLVKQDKRNKLASFYDPSPYKVVQVKGSQITAGRQGRTIERNSSFFKKVTAEAAAKWRGSDCEDDDHVPQPVVVPVMSPERPDQTQRRYPVRENRGVPPARFGAN